MNTRSKSVLNNIPPNANSISIKDIMETSKTALYEVNIDFDEASKAWKANKKYIGNGSYKYVCCGITKTGNKCNKQSLEFVDYCKMHMKK
jgi:hypothetical protein